MLTSLHCNCTHVVYYTQKYYRQIPVCQFFIFLSVQINKWKFDLIFVIIICILIEYALHFTLSYLLFIMDHHFIADFSNGVLEVKPTSAVVAVVVLVVRRLVPRRRLQIPPRWATRMQTTRCSRYPYPMRPPLRPMAVWLMLSVPTSVYHQSARTAHPDQTTLPRLAELGKTREQFSYAAKVIKART